jgi:hypothetical protein
MINISSLENVDSITIIAMCISTVAISLAIYLYLMTKIFEIKKYKEKKREAVFNWVHENLIEDVYIPLAEYALAISDTLLQGEYNEEEVVLYRISKFLQYIFKNRAVFGGDVYFTPNKRSNKRLESISKKIISEINTTYDLQSCPTERRIVILEFLATCAKSKNYSEFRLLIGGRSIANKDLTDEIGRLMDGYSDNHYLPHRYGDCSSVFLNPINELMNPQSCGQEWIRAKLYAYCSLFNKLLMYEIHKMYDSWYVKYPDTLKYHQLVGVISLVDGIIEKVDGKLKSYSKSSIEDTREKLKILKQNPVSNKRPTDKKEIEQKIKELENQLEMLESVEHEISKSAKLLYVISPHRYEVLKKNKSEEFYKSVSDMCYSFSWDDIPGDGSKRLLQYLINDHGISWAESAKIRKSEDGKTIHIFKDKKSVKIKINEKREKATLRIRYGITHDLKVERKNNATHIIDLKLLKNY